MSDDINPPANPRTDPLAPPETPAPASGRKAPVPKRKKPGAYRVPPRENRHGLFIVNTGDGKGKTTAALGLLLRATGREMHAAMFQFVKRLTDGGEHRAAERLGVEIVALGAGCTLGRDDLADDATLAREGWARCRELIVTGTYDVLILDELTLPVAWGWIDAAAVVDAIKARPRGTHIVVTGRNAPPEFIDAADLVTDMRAVKHPYHDQPVVPRGERRGLLIVNTGDGKGKTTAALGILVRAAGYDLSVGMFQFIKSAETRYGEHIAASVLGVDIVPLGDGFTWLSQNIDEDRALAERGWTRVAAAIEAAKFDVLILDEMTYCLTFGWLDEARVLETLKSRPPWMHIVVTGRDASPALVEAADLVTEMHLVRHPYREQGIGAQPGIEL